MEEQLVLADYLMERFGMCPVAALHLACGGSRRVRKNAGAETWTGVGTWTGTWTWTRTWTRTQTEMKAGTWTPSTHQ